MGSALGCVALARGVFTAHLFITSIYNASIYKVRDA